MTRAPSFALALTLAACVGQSGTLTPSDGATGGGGNDGRGGGGGDGGTDPGGLEPGTLQVSWMHGSADCAQNTDPEVQVHAYNATTHIIRQNKCRTFEAPFIYLIEGNTAALLIDSGATTTTTLRTTVRSLIGTKPLIVAHSHGHGDHKAGDGTFSGQPSTTVVATTVAAVQSQFMIATWPTSAGTIDLGGRVLDVLGIPGHEATHIAIYDRRTGLLFTGDSLYPGLLVVRDWSAFRQSIARLVDHTQHRGLSHILGGHIEMKSTPGHWFGYPALYQPDEHVLPLSAAHLEELHAACEAMAHSPRRDIHDDFIIQPPE